MSAGSIEKSSREQTTLNLCGGWLSVGSVDPGKNLFFVEEEPKGESPFFPFQIMTICTGSRKYCNG